MTAKHVASETQGLLQITLSKLTHTSCEVNNYLIIKYQNASCQEKGVVFMHLNKKRVKTGNTGHSELVLPYITENTLQISASTV